MEEGRAGLVGLKDDGLPNIILVGESVRWERIAERVGTIAFCAQNKNKPYFLIIPFISIIDTKAYYRRANYETSTIV